MDSLLSGLWSGLRGPGAYPDSAVAWLKPEFSDLRVDVKTPAYRVLQINHSPELKVFLVPDCRAMDPLRQQPQAHFQTKITTQHHTSSGQQPLLPSPPGATVKTEAGDLRATHFISSKLSSRAWPAGTGCSWTGGPRPELGKGKGEKKKRENVRS